MIILDGKKIAEKIIVQLRKEVDTLRDRGIVPGLGILLIGDDPASQLYVSMKQKTAEAIGMKCTFVSLAASVTESEAIESLHAMSNDPTLHGVMVQIPVPKHLSRERICSAIAPAKDIDCLNPETLKKLADGDLSITPPTAESVVRLIEASGRACTHTRIVTVGSGFFSRQITDHLRNKGARVEQIPFQSDELAKNTLSAEIVVAAVGRPGVITRGMIRDGAVVIDVGVTRQHDSVVGDVRFDEVAEIASAITPVPGGVGPVTVAVLLENVVKAAARSVDA